MGPRSLPAGLALAHRFFAPKPSAEAHHPVAHKLKLLGLRRPGSTKRDIRFSAEVAGSAGRWETYPALEEHSQLKPDRKSEAGTRSLKPPGLSSKQAKPRRCYEDTILSVAGQAPDYISHSPRRPDVTSLLTSTLHLSREESRVEDHSGSSKSHGPGLSISKPDVISLLEQGKEPWMMANDATGPECPGKQGLAVGEIIVAHTPLDLGSRCEKFPQKDMFEVDPFNWEMMGDLKSCDLEGSSFRGTWEYRGPFERQHVHQECCFKQKKSRKPSLRKPADSTRGAGVRFRISQALFRAFSSTARTHMANRVAEKQKLFQADNDLPVHLKGGGADNLLYRLTMALVTGGERQE
ncbi:Zinc finger protein 565 [Galemys pyrenaicus]|uniref:Cytochrome c oxidase subunit 7A1, mitochondrial n=1 Tax=Galemys pyrenaicus TaxID=202257 RepID=A0A8J6DXT6_GALPY|nr:Zinc finger protein 565 [Galemys pyrenaicus]